jgi:foldase protein PrsA
MKKLLLSVFAGSALLLAGCSEDGAEVASSEAGRIREEDLYEAMKSEPLEGGMTVGEAVLQRMLLSDIFEVHYGDQVTEEDVQAEYEASAQIFGSVEDYEELLEMQGIDPQLIKDNIRSTLLIRTAIRDHAEITEEDIQAQYEAQKPEATVQHILVEDEETANNIINQLEEGADFGELVAEHSLDEASVEQDGTISFSQGEMVPQFEEAALALEEGETTSEPVQTDYGYHVIRRLELDAAPIEEVRDELELSVIDGYMQDQAFMTEMITELAREANVTITDEELQGAMAAYMPQPEQTETEQETEEDAAEETQEEAPAEEPAEEETTEEDAENTGE